MNGVEFRNIDNIAYCCQVLNGWEHEAVVKVYSIAYVVTGELDILYKGKRHHLQRGHAHLICPNHKCHKIAYPERNGTPFKGLFIQLDIPMLRKVMHLYGLTTKEVPKDSQLSPYMMLPDHPLLKGLFMSVEQYFELSEWPSEQLLKAKIEEVILTLVEIKPELKQRLFDFTSSWRTGLREFMEHNYTDDLSLQEFANSSGRSLATFKRDFEAAFHEPPRKWIIRRRLEEARRLIETEHRPINETYQRVGFKNFSHFSTAYKREFGYPPSAK